MNIYYNYTMKKICSQTFVKSAVYSPHNEPFPVFFYVLNFCMGLRETRVHCKGEFYIGNIQKLSLPFSNCLCGCWCKDINLWPHHILAWMIVVCLFGQHIRWVCSAILVTKSSVMQSLKNSTGGEDLCRKSWGLLKFFCRVSSILCIRE